MKTEFAAQFRLDPGEEQPVVVDDEHPDPTPGRRHATLGMLS